MLVCLVPRVSGAATGSDIFFGDVNGDTQIDVADAIVLLRYIVGLNDLEPDQIGRANAVSYTHLDVYKRQGNDQFAAMAGAIFMDERVAKACLNAV